MGYIPLSHDIRHSLWGDKFSKRCIFTRVAKKKKKKIYIMGRVGYISLEIWHGMKDMEIDTHLICFIVLILNRKGINIESSLYLLSMSRIYFFFHSCLHFIEKKVVYFNSQISSKINLYIGNTSSVLFLAFNSCVFT